MDDDAAPGADEIVLRRPVIGCLRRFTHAVAKNLSNVSTSGEAHAQTCENMQRRFVMESQAGCSTTRMGGLRLVSNLTSTRATGRLRPLASGRENPRWFREKERSA